MSDSNEKTVKVKLLKHRNLPQYGIKLARPGRVLDVEEEVARVWERNGVAEIVRNIQTSKRTVSKKVDAPEETK